MMNTDILFKTDDHIFSYRVAGICVHNEKVLLHKAKGDEGYAFPGGHVSFGETNAETPDEFHTAGDYRDSIPAKKSSVIARSYDLFINIDDRAGAIATIATILSVNGISIKNIGIIHNREYVDGVMKLELYKEDDEKKARELLIQNRYDIVDRD